MKNLSTSASNIWERRQSQDIEQNVSFVAADISSFRARLRVSVLLNTMPKYHVEYINSSIEFLDIIEKIDLVLATGDTAREGILHRKPVIVVGKYGLDGLITPYNLHDHYNNRFRGKISGMKDDYFSLERLKEEIKKSSNLTLQELQMMSNQLTTFLHNDF